MGKKSDFIQIICELNIFSYLQLLHFLKIHVSSYIHIL